MSSLRSCPEALHPAGGHKSALRLLWPLLPIRFIFKDVHLQVFFGSVLFCVEQDIQTWMCNNPLKTWGSGNMIRHDQSSQFGRKQSRLYGYGVVAMHALHSRETFSVLILITNTGNCCCFQDGRSFLFVSQLSCGRSYCLIALRRHRQAGAGRIKVQILCYCN